MAEAERIPPLDWRMRGQPQEWLAQAGAGKELLLVVHYAHDCPVSVVNLVGKIGHRDSLTCKAVLFRRRPDGIELLREGYADTVRQAQALAEAWLDRLLGPAGGAGSGAD